MVSLESALLSFAVACLLASVNRQILVIAISKVNSPVFIVAKPQQVPTSGVTVVQTVDSESPISCGDLCLQVTTSTCNGFVFQKATSGVASSGIHGKFGKCQLMCFTSLTTVTFEPAQNDSYRFYAKSIMLSEEALSPANSVNFLHRDCADRLDQGQVKNGVYTIFTVGDCGKPVNVYCDMTTDGGGWTVIQKRFNGSVDFYRSWNEYASGFGQADGEYWLGNDNIHNMTSTRKYMLRIDMSDFAYVTRYAVYSYFKVEAANVLYKVSSLGTYSGTAGDAMTLMHYNQGFTTYDRDYDQADFNCAQTYKGGWWYGWCHEANLNGLYLDETAPYGVGISWLQWHGYYYSLKTAEMKIRAG